MEEKKQTKTEKWVSYYSDLFSFILACIRNTLIITLLFILAFGIKTGIMFFFYMIQLTMKEVKNFKELINDRT